MKGSLSKAKIVIIAGVLVLAGIIAGVSLANRFGPFKSKKVIEVAKDYGMRELTREEFDRRWEGGMFDAALEEAVDKIINSPAFFVSDDVSEANQIYTRYFALDTNDYPGLEEFIECEDPKAFFDLYMMTCMNKESAKMLYDRWVKYWREDDDTTSYSGKQNGYDYSIIYYPVSENRCRCFGMYLKGNTYIMIYSVEGDGIDATKLDSFCKKLGLVTPTASKN